MKKKKTQKVWCLVPVTKRASYPADFGPLACYLKPTVLNWGFKEDSDFKLDRKIMKLLWNPPFLKKNLRQLAKVKPLCSQQHLEPVIHDAITSLLDCCNALYFRVSQSSLKRLQLVQNAAACSSNGSSEEWTHLDSFHWLPVHFKIILFGFKWSRTTLPLWAAPPECTCLRSPNQTLLEVTKQSHSLSIFKIWP